MTRLLIALGVLALAAFVWVWPPASLLTFALAAFWLAAERNANARKGTR